MAEACEEFILDGMTFSIPTEHVSHRLRTVFTSGDYEGDEKRLLDHALGQGDVLLECGTGIGYLACCAAQRIGASNVTTIEAHAAMVDVARANLAANGFGDVRVLHGAVMPASFSDETVLFEQIPAFWASRVASANSRQERILDVPAVRFDHLMHQTRPTVILMDVEGAEQHILRDADLASNTHTIVFETHPKRYPHDAIEAVSQNLIAQGFERVPIDFETRIWMFRRTR